MSVMSAPAPAIADPAIAGPEPVSAPPRRGAMYPRPLVFIHIPKAAGTTLAEIIVRQYMGGRGLRFTGEQVQEVVRCRW